MALNILQLPDEIKVNIFKYLSGIDKIEILRVCKDFQRIGADRDVLQHLDFTKNYKLTLSYLKLIGRKTTASFVTYLNLNGIHWIPSAALRDAIMRFKNVNILYVVDTQLFVRDLVQVTEVLTKIRKLALSLKSDSCADILRSRFNVKLTHLYLVYNSYSVKSIFRLLGQIEELEELWLVEPKRPNEINKMSMPPWTQYLPLFDSVPKVRKKIVYTRLYDQILDEENFFNRLKDSTRNWVSFPNIFPSGILFRIDEAVSCQGLEDCNCKGKIDCKKTKEAQMLNLSTTLMHNQTLLKELLYCKTPQSLRKIKCESQIFWRQSERRSSEPQVSLFKRARIGINSTTLGENSLFKNFCEISKDMEDFEIVDLDPVGARANLWKIEDLIFVKNWEILKKLTITSVNFHSGKFLIDITRNCRMLSCLKIQDELVQDNITLNLCEALPFARNLKDFRYQRKGTIPVDHLFESLNKCLKLERLYVQCRNTSKISKKPLETIITRCENLVFLFIYISELHETVCKSIKQSINEFGVKPQQIINIRGQSYEIKNISYEDIPSCQIEEIICQENEASYDYVRTFFR